MNILIGNANLDKIIQDRTIARSIGEALFPGLLFRAAAHRERWEARAGQTMEFLNPGLFRARTKPRNPAVEPGFAQLDYEKYKATMNLYGDKTQVHMPSNYVTAISPYLEKQHKFSLAAAQVLNRLPRNRLYQNYSAGHAIVDAILAAGLEVQVSALNGFTETPDPLSGSLVPVSSANPREFNVNGVLAGSQIIGTIPDDTDFPLGPGRLVLDVAVGGLAAGNRIDALDASVVIRPNGAPTVDGITAGKVLTMDLIRKAISSLRRDNVGPCADGYYHVHFDPLGEEQLQLDNSFQRQIEGMGLDVAPYLKFAVGRTAGCTFFANNEVPRDNTVDPDSFVQTRPASAPLAFGSGDVGLETTNAGGIELMNTIVIGQSALCEKHLNENAFMSEAGVAGRVGGMRATNGGVEIDLDGIRFILKAPTDAFNENVTLAWSWAGDHVCPTNRLTGTSSGGRNAAGDRVGVAYKRARLIQTALN